MLNVAAVGAGYSDLWELLTDALAALDLRLSMEMEEHARTQGAAQALAGVMVTRIEAENALADAARLYPEDLGDSEWADALALFESRFAATPPENPFRRLCAAFSLTAFERWCVLLALAPEIDPKYEKPFAYLQDDILKKRPGAHFAAALLGDASRPCAVQARELLLSPRLARLFGGEALANAELRLPRAAVNALLAPEDAAIPDPPERVPLNEEALGALAALLEAGSAPPLAALIGPEGAGRRSLLTAACVHARMPLALVDLSNAKEPAALVRDALLPLALSRRAAGLILAPGRDTPDIARAVTELLEPIAAAGSLVCLIADAQAALPARPALRLTLDLPDARERLALFEHYARGRTLLGDVRLDELAAKFRLTPAAIRGAFEFAETARSASGEPAITARLVHRACYEQLSIPGDTLITRTEPSIAFDDLVLPAKQKRLMQEAVDQVRNQYTVHVAWGFEKKLPYGRGVSVLLSGPPGTGKTMAAQVVAGALNMQLYKIQLSQVVDKYIGETEKNLRRVFEQARGGSAVLFFDECDALFGKRAEVRDAQDRHANVEVAYLLQQLEEYEGVILLATNLLANIDAAFMRRMRFVIHFPFPDNETRVMLYQKSIPPETPRRPDIDFAFLAEKFHVAGGGVKNITLHASFLAAAQNEPLGMAHLLKAAVAEQEKAGTVVVREDLREYGDLLGV